MPAPSQKQINFAKSIAKRRNEPLPDGLEFYSAGVLHNGLNIWPIEPHALFRQTIFESNADLSDLFDNRFVYFGQRDKELYVFEPAKQCYCAIEFVGKPVWAEFQNDPDMFEFMLQRAWE
jgi:hypothetical protein